MRTLVQMGIGRADVVDGDTVETSNLNRQFFFPTDIGKPKAHRLIHNVARFSVDSTVLRGYYGWFQEFMGDPSRGEYRVVIAGVDNDEANIAVSAFAIRRAIPAVFVNVSEDGNACRVFIQRPGQACFACYEPSALMPRKVDPGKGCPPVPAIGDILLVASGLAVRAAIGELFGKPISRRYNCRDITFVGHDIQKTVQRNPQCPLCRRAA